MAKIKSKKVTPIIVIAFILGLITWKLSENKQTLNRNAELSLVVNTIVPVMVENPQYMVLDETIEATGCVGSEKEVTVYSKSQGIVTKKYREMGDAVSKGTVIAQLENSVIKENLRLSELDVAKAKKDVERYQRLASVGAVTIRELEEAQLTLRAVESRITDLQEQLRHTAITAPFSGIINKDYFEEGTLLSVGSSVADIVDNNTSKMIVNVTEKEVLELKVGMDAIITSNAYPGSTFAGRISAIAPKSNAQYHYSVELALNHSQLKPGMFATAIFNVGENNRNALVISREAIAGSMKDPQVFVIRNSKAYKVAVQVGISNGEYIEITDGMSPDDIVVKSGQINLIDGTKVSILNK